MRRFVRAHHAGGLRFTMICRVARLLILMVALQAVCALAAENVQRLATDEFLPYIDRSQPEGGYYPALISRVLAESGERAEFVYRPWLRAHLETRDGRFDGSFPYLRSAERERDFVFSDSLLDVEAHFFVRAEQVWSERPLEQVSGKRTCYLQDSLLAEPLQKLLEANAFRIERVSDMAQCFRMLAAGRVDFVSAGSFNAWATIKKIYGEEHPFKTVGPALDRTPLHLVWPRSNPLSESRREAFNAALKRLRDSGEVARLQRELLPAE
jgi:polar amino acid transport system substrate-binding protein